MATKFKKGQAVKVDAVIPAGVVEALRMDDDGVVYCYFSWTDLNGVKQERWFAEDSLVAA